MPRHVDPALKAEALRMRIDERASGPEIKAKTGLSFSTIYSVIGKHPLTREQMNTYARRRCAWTPAENALLERLWPYAARDVIEAALPTRNWEAIGKRAADRKILRTRQSRSKRADTVDPFFLELREIRESRRIHRKQLADKIGHHYIQIAKWELGETVPRWLALRDWLAGLNVKIKVIEK